MKAIILMIDTPISHEYAKTASGSCEAVGIEWEYFQGYHNMSSYQAYMKTGIKMPNLIDDPAKSKISPWGCASAGHAAIWKKIADGDDDTVIILEHDALMLHPLTIDIPDNTMAVLGYKLHNPKRYDHIKAGPPKQLINISTHQGAHAYVITKNTAKLLVKEIEDLGHPIGNIDQQYFIRSNRGAKYKTNVPLSLVDPTPAIGWARKTTVWNREAANAPNATFIDSFKRHLR